MKQRPPNILSRLGCALASLLAIGCAWAQPTPTLVAYWDFNNASNPDQTLDKLYAFVGGVEGGAAFTPDTGGRTGASGDYAMDFGYDSNKQLVRVSGAPFLTTAATQDKITIVFWQNLYDVAASSAFWGVSPSSNNGQRGIQAHVTWSDNNIYFDTAGCCEATLQRINKVMDGWPDYFDQSFWNVWHHLAFVKDGAVKQIWIDGQKFHEGTNTSPLPLDFVELIIGAASDAGNSMHGILDDFAVFAGALSPESIALLASGTAPDKLPGVGVSTDPLVGAAAGNLSGFVVEINDSVAKQVAVASVTVQLDGQPVSATVNKAGSVTTITYQDLSKLFPSGSSHEVAIAFQDTTGASYTATRSFSVVVYATLTTDLWSPAGSADTSKPGFNVRIHQVDPGDTVLGTGGETSGEAQGRYTANVIESAEAQLAGLYGPNVADLTTAVGGVFAVPTVINFDIAAGAAGNFSASAAPPNDVPDEYVPGIPGASANPTASVAGEFLTYVEFPQAGYYRMGVNSDDDFRVSEAETLARQYCVVEAPAAIAGALASVPAVYRLQGQFGGEMPIDPPLVADALLAEPADGCADLTNAEALKGKIALINRGTCGFVVKAREAQEAGAAAVIIINDRLQYPFTMGADPLGPDLTIPSLMISQADGDKLKANLNGLRISLGSDPAPRLGEFNNNGRGAADTIFGFVVPTAGVYPLRCVWQQGGGGGNVEWFTVNEDDTKVLLNDSKAGALKAYRARTFTPKPTIAISRGQGSVVITYTGTLEAADAVAGPWSEVAGTSPQTIPTSAAQKFYRAKR